MGSRQFLENATSHAFILVVAQPKFRRAFGPGYMAYRTIQRCPAHLARESRGAQNVGVVFGLQRVIAAQDSLHASAGVQSDW
jgi:hypothetical protein